MQTSWASRGWGRNPAIPRGGAGLGRSCRSPRRVRRGRAAAGARSPVHACPTVTRDGCRNMGRLPRMRRVSRGLPPGGHQNS
eukprot:8486276-Pyramimonas_sp.AAC.1